MTKGLSNELIAERRLEEFRENIKSGMEHMANDKRFRRVAVRAFVGMSGIWHLDPEEASSLLSMSVRDYEIWQASDGTPMDTEVLEKISCLLGIYSCLGTVYSGSEKHIRRWLKNRNDRDGKTPLQLLARQPTISFYKLRRSVAAQTQGY